MNLDAAISNKQTIITIIYMYYTHMYVCVYAGVLIKSLDRDHSKAIPMARARYMMYVQACCFLEITTTLGYFQVSESCGVCQIDTHEESHLVVTDRRSRDTNKQPLLTNAAFQTARLKL